MSSRSFSPSLALLGGVVAGAGMMYGLKRLAGLPPPISFKGKVVLVTGGSRGLGLVLLRQLVARGAKVGFCARNDDEVARAVKDLEGRGGDVFACVADITEEGEAVRFVEAAADRFGAIDAIINNAGTIIVGPAEEMTRADYEESLNLHFWAAYEMVQAALPHLKRAARKQGGARIVNISSIGGKIAAPHLLPYDTSKFALAGFSEGLRAELMKDRIAVTTVCPGLMRTGSPEHAIFKGRNKDEHAWFTISSSLPLLTVDAETAARRILDAAAQGSAEVVLSAPYRVATVLKHLFPGAATVLLAAVNRLLPSPGGVHRRRRTGRQSSSSLAPSPLTTLTERAALANNER